MASTRSSLLLACSLLLAVAATNAAPQKAPRFMACRRDQSPAQLNECVRDSIQRAIPELVKGIPEFGLTSLDPLRVGNLEIPKNKNSAVNVELSFKNLDVRGLKNIVVKSIDLNLKKYKLNGKMDVFGNVYLQGDYTIKGNVLILPITGAGRCNISLVDIKGEITELQSKPFMKNNTEYIKVTSLKFVVYNTKRVYYNLENLFNGNKELGDNMLLVLNENWKAIFDDMVGPVQKTLGEAFRGIINKVASKVPFNAFFPNGN